MSHTVHFSSSRRLVCRTGRFSRCGLAFDDSGLVSASVSVGLQSGTRLMWMFVAAFIPLFLSGCSAFPRLNQTAASRQTVAIKRQNRVDYRAVANTARSSYQDGNLSGAIAGMEKAAELNDGDSQLHVELGEYYLADGQWLQAQRHAEKGLEKNYRLASAWNLNGKVKAAKGDLRGALADYQHAVGLDANRQDIQLQIAEIYGQLNQPMRSLAAIEQLLSHFPPDDQPESAVLTKSLALMKLDQLQPAIELLEVASRSRMATSEVFVRLGQAQLLAGQSSQARLTLARAEKSFPQQGQLHELTQQLQEAGTRVAVLSVR